MITVRDAISTDSEMILAWRNHRLTRLASLDSGIITFDRHSVWYQRALNSADTFIYIAENEGRPIGCVKFKVSNDSACISIFLNPEYIGCGHGRSVLGASLSRFRNEMPCVTRINATVLSKNIASVNLFEKYGFAREGHFMSLYYQ